jgi:integrase
VEDMGIGENERIFKMTVRNVNYVIDRYSDVISAHDCRRTYTTNLLKDGVPLVKVQKALGHSNARTTERYLIDNDVYDGDVGDFVTW